MNDGLIFNCINRADENPFVGNIKADNKTTWLQVSNTKCPSEKPLRCLGRIPEQCVNIGFSRKLTDF